MNVDKRHAFVKMLTRGDAMSAKDGMERYKSDEMQLRVSRPSTSLIIPPFTNSHRLVGVSALDHETAVTTLRASVSSPSIDSQMLIVNGCSPPNMEERAANP